MKELHRSCCFARKVNGAQIIVNGVGVVVPHARQLLPRVSDRRIVSVVIGLIILRGNISPCRAAHAGHESGHERSCAVGIADRVTHARVIKCVRLPPTPENEVDLRVHLHVSAEIRHVDRHGLSRCDPRRAGGRGHTDINRGRRDAHRRHDMWIGRGRAHTAVAGHVECLVAPQGLHRERGVIIHRNITKTLPRTLVTVLAPLHVVPAVLDAGKIVWVGDTLGVLVPGDDAVAIEDPVAKAIADHVHRVHSTAAGAEARPVHIEERDEGILQPVRVAKPVDTVRLCVVSAINWLSSGNGCRRSEDDVCRLRIVLEVSGCAYRFHGERIIGHVFRQTQGDDVAGHRRRVGPHTLELFPRIGDVTSAADAGAAGGPGRDIVTIFRLDGPPRCAAEIAQERSDVVL